MQVFFGESDELLGRSWWQKTKGATKKAGRVTGRAATAGFRTTAKAVKVVRPIAPALALVPGVGTAAAAGIIAANQGINATRSLRKAGTAAKSVLPANLTSRKFVKTVSPARGIPANLTSRSFAKTVKPTVKPRVTALTKQAFKLPSVEEITKKIPGFPGSTPAPAPAPEKSALEKNLPLIGIGLAALLLMRKR